MRTLWVGSLGLIVCAAVCFSEGDGWQEAVGGFLAMPEIGIPESARTAMILLSDDGGRVVFQLPDRSAGGAFNRASGKVTEFWADVPGASRLRVPKIAEQAASDAAWRVAGRVWHPEWPPLRLQSQQQCPKGYVFTYRAWREGVWGTGMVIVEVEWLTGRVHRLDLFPPSKLEPPATPEVSAQQAVDTAIAYIRQESQHTPTRLDTFDTYLMLCDVPFPEWAGRPGLVWSVWLRDPDPRACPNLYEVTVDAKRPGKVHGMGADWEPPDEVRPAARKRSVPRDKDVAWAGQGGELAVVSDRLTQRGYMYKLFVARGTDLPPEQVTHDIACLHAVFSPLGDVVAVDEASQATQRGWHLRRWPGLEECPPTTARIAPQVVCVWDHEGRLVPYLRGDRLTKLDVPPLIPGAANPDAIYPPPPKPQQGRGGALSLRPVPPPKLVPLQFQMIARRLSELHPLPSWDDKLLADVGNEGHRIAITDAEGKVLLEREFDHTLADAEWFMDSHRLLVSFEPQDYPDWLGILNAEDGSWTLVPCREPNGGTLWSYVQTFGPLKDTWHHRPHDARLSPRGDKVAFIAGLETDIDYTELAFCLDLTTGKVEQMTTLPD